MTIFSTSNEIKKIVFIDKTDVSLKDIKRVNKIVTETGNENQRGYLNTAPTIFRYVDDLYSVFTHKKMEFKGSYYEKVECLESDNIRVFCHVGVFNELMNESLAIEKYFKLAEEVM